MRAGSPITCVVGWRDRDWARWTDEERASYLTGSTRMGASAPAGQRFGFRQSSQRGVTLFAMLVSLGLSLLTWHFHLLRFVGQHAPAQAPLSTIVYGTGLAHFNEGSQEMTCTAMAANGQGIESCTTWTLLSPGQQPVQAAALPTGTNCTAVQADQHTGRWVCTAPASNGAAT
jgi:hypothetical protein